MNKTIIKNIKRIRKEKKMTQQTLGEIVGVSGATIARYESGEIAISTDMLFMISDALNVDVDDLIYSEKALPYDEVLDGGMIIDDLLEESSSQTPIDISDLTDAEIRELIEYKNFLIWRRNNGKV